MEFHLIDSRIGEILHLDDGFSDDSYDWFVADDAPSAAADHGAQDVTPTGLSPMADQDGPTGWSSGWPSGWPSGWSAAPRD